MNTYTDLSSRLAVPVIAAPMFLVSGPDLVIAACLSGVIGAFPTVNARTSADLADWLIRINAALDGQTCPHTGRRPAPVAANLIVHPVNVRLKDDLEVLRAHPTEIVITSVGSPASVVGPLHEAGSLVFADVATLGHARRAVEAGVDGLILLSAGAGGQTGWVNPFAFVRAVRQFFDGTVVLAGGISDGVGVRAAITLGADLAYMGTRFLSTTESMASAEHKTMVAESNLDDVTLTTAITGLPTNMLRRSLEACGIDTGKNAKPQATVASQILSKGGKLRNWRDLWSAGHSVSGVNDIPNTAELTQRILNEYHGGEASAGPG